MEPLIAPSVAPPVTMGATNKVKRVRQVMCCNSLWM